MVLGKLDIHMQKSETRLLYSDKIKFDQSPRYKVRNMDTLRKQFTENTCSSINDFLHRTPDAQVIILRMDKWKYMKF